jgi:hypothetical protein
MMIQENFHCIRAVNIRLGRNIRTRSFILLKKPAAKMLFYGQFLRQIAKKRML